MFRLTRRRLAVFAALIAGVLATSACGSEVGAAAVVNGSRIDVATVQDAHSDLEDIAVGLTQTDVLSMLVVAPMWVEVGSENGIGFTDQQIQETFDALVEQAGVESREFGPGAVDALRSDLILSTIANSPNADALFADVQQRVEQADIETNPRFGNFSAQNGMQPVTPEWLVDSPANPLDSLG